MQNEELTQLVHRLPHRVRLRASALVGHPDVCRRLAEMLVMAEPGVERVEVRPWTGSVIAWSEDGTVDAERVRALLSNLVAEEHDEQGRRLTGARPDHMPGPTRVARAVAHAFAEINADIREALDHRADLGTLLPVLFFSLGLVEVGVTRKLPAPAWFNLLWWSLRSFMTFNQGAVEQEQKAEDGASAASAARGG
jgi:hypothetical protein